MTRRCAVVAILGAPNAGKSTLVNALVGEKVAIVTHKVQTTRAPLRGVAMRGDVQLVLIDTPGVFAPKRRLDRAMVRAAWGALDGADAIAHVVDAAAAARVASGEGTGADAKAQADAETIRTTLKKAGKTAILVLNKVDAMPRAALLGLAQKLSAEGVYDDVFMISALTGDGVEDLATRLAALAPEGPWLFPEDQIADAPARVLAAETTREKLMLRLHDELPYETTVETETWEERKDGSVRIEQTIYVARESQRKIAIGEKGQTVKAIGEAARKELEATLGRRVHLFLHVKLRENWSEERARYRALGLDYDA
ncbi:MAG: GTPase Era [Hydrogenophilaceae bacterium]|jgi:GTP-binding protein Era|nr:GTPase Era [Hydrogenophilaceae bacterium]